MCIRSSRRACAGSFRGPEEIRNLLVKNATDLGRDPNFQRGGLVDVMRAI
jgi:hypothetical protein